MPLIPEFLEYGLVGILAVIASKSIDFATDVYKSRKEPEPDEKSKVELVVEEIKLSVKRIERVVIDGNGKPGLVTQVALIDQKLTDHVSDDNVHMQ